MKAFCAALAFAAAVALAAPTQAQQPAPTAAQAQVKADEDLVVAAFNALNTGGYGKLAQHVPTLRTVLDHAPARMEPGSDAALVYGTTAMLLAMYANELKHYDEAVGYGQRGLVLIPDDDRLTSETALAYGGLKRPAEALRIIEAWLARGLKADPLVQARMLRAKGFALIELSRLDEAEQAYRAALKLEPDHKGAQNELTYIAGLKGGKAPTPGVTTTYDKAKSGDYDQPRDP